MPLDFASAARLFMGTEAELATALDLSIADFRSARTNPQAVPPELMARFGSLLVERGRGMQRVGELLLESNPK